MRTYDFAPLWRSSVGFDRLFDLINETQRLDAKTTTRPTTSYVRATTGTVFRWLSPASRPTRSPPPRSRTSSQSSATRLTVRTGHRLNTSIFTKASQRGASNVNSTSKITLRSRERRSRTACCR
jgi:hypothetical protein